MSTLREAAQQALEALQCSEPGRGFTCTCQGSKHWPSCRWQQHQDAITALRAALVEQDDDLTAAWMAGAAAERKRAEQSLRDLCAAAYQVVGVADGPVEMLDNLVDAAEGEPLPDDPGAGLLWSPPSPQPLTELPPLPEPAGKLYSYNYTADQMRDYARAVEAEVLKRMGVQR